MPTQPTNYDQNNRQFAVVIVDMQPGFLKGFATYEVQKLISAQRQLLKACATHDIPAIDLRMNRYGATVLRLRTILRKYRRRESLWKSEQSGFSNTQLADHLEKWKITDICLIGINASLCVKSTGASAIESGYRIASSDALIGNDTRVRERYPHKHKNWYQKSGTFFQKIEPLAEHMDISLPPPHSWKTVTSQFFRTTIKPQKPSQQQYP